MQGHPYDSARASILKKYKPGENIQGFQTQFQSIERG